MKKLLLSFVTLIVLLLPQTAFAILGPGTDCRKINGDPIIGSNGQVEHCDPAQDLVCQEQRTSAGRTGFICVKGSSTTKVFGVIDPPTAVNNIGFGSLGISNLLNTSIILIYVVAGIAFLFMIIFSGFQWVTSGGDKEKVAQARARLTHAIIGIVLLALAFLIAKLVGQVTGFEFFQNQNVGPAPTPQNLPSIPGSGRSIPI